MRRVLACWKSHRMENSVMAYFHSQTVLTLPQISIRGLKFPAGSSSGFTVGKLCDEIKLIQSQDQTDSSVNVF